MRERETTIPFAALCGWSMVWECGSVGARLSGSDWTQVNQTGTPCEPDFYKNFHMHHTQSSIKTNFR